MVSLNSGLSPTRVSSPLWDYTVSYLPESAVFLSFVLTGTLGGAGNLVLNAYSPCLIPQGSVRGQSS